MTKVINYRRVVLPKICKQCGGYFIKRWKESYKQYESKKYCSPACQAEGFVGFKMPQEIVERLAKEKTGKSAWWKKGELNYFWKGGKTPEILAERMSLAYKNWRRAIFDRDNYKCVLCGIKGGWNKKLKKEIKLNADHIKSFTHYPLLRYKLSNGRTLCVDCHKQTDTFAGKSRK